MREAVRDGKRPSPVVLRGNVNGTVVIFGRGARRVESHTRATQIIAHDVDRERELRGSGRTPDENARDATFCYLQTRTCGGGGGKGGGRTPGLLRVYVVRRARSVCFVYRVKSRGKEVRRHLIREIHAGIVSRYKTIREQRRTCAG